MKPLIKGQRIAVYGVVYDGISCSFCGSLNSRNVGTVIKHIGNSVTFEIAERSHTANRIQCRILKSRKKLGLVIWSGTGKCHVTYGEIVVKSESIPLLLSGNYHVTMRVIP